IIDASSLSPNYNYLWWYLRSRVKYTEQEKKQLLINLAIEGPYNSPCINPHSSPTPNPSIPSLTTRSFDLFKLH
ncbi:hypothetical protein BT96DRAFT_304057, partial [Gymnopus androsaceus JB14]